MTTAIIEATAAIQNVATRAKEEALDEVLDIIDAKEQAIMKLLQNGMPIYEAAWGQRFNRLYKQRQKLWHKAHAYGKIYATIAELRCKY